MSRALVVLALALFGSFVGPARAARPLEVLIIDNGSSELARKVRAEVLYAGFSAIDADDNARLAGAALDGASARALASIRIVSEHRLELHLAQAGEASVYTQAFVRRPGEGDSFALRVVEQLRARLIGAGSRAAGAASGSDQRTTQASPPDAAPVNAPGAAPSLASGAEGAPSTPPDAPPRPTAPDVGAPAPARAAPTLWLDAGVGGSFAAGGLGATAHALVGVRMDLGSAWGVSATSLYPFADNRVEASEGEARVSWHVFAAGLDYSLPWRRPWMASVGIGAGLLALDVQGQGRESFVGQRDRLLASAYHVELCAGRQLTSWLRLRATLLTGLNAPRPVLRFDEREVASLGRWFGTLGLSFDVGLPLGAVRGH